MSRYCTALLKAVSFTDFNPLGACVAEEQQSDENSLKMKTSRAYHEVATKISEEQCHCPQEKFQFSP